MTAFAKNPILRAYGTSILGVVSGLLTNLWLLRAVTHAISPQEFGIYAFSLQILSYLTILQLGLDFAVSRQIAEALGQNDLPRANQAFWELRRFNSWVLGVFGAAVVVIALTLWQGVGVPRASGLLAAQVALIGGVAQLILITARPYDAALIGSQHQPVVNLALVTRTISSTVIAYGLFRMGWGVVGLCSAEVITQCAYFFAVRHWCGVCCPWRTLSAPAPDNHALKALLKFSGLVTFGSLAWTIEATCDVFLLGWLGGPALVAVYVLWWRFPQMVFDFCTRLATSAFPGLTARHGISAQMAVPLFNKVAYTVLGLATLGYVGIGLWLNALTHLWLGDAYALPNGSTVALLLGLLICLRTCGNFLGLFWLATGRPQLTTVLAWTQVAVKVGLGVLLVRQYQIAGLVTASCAASLLQVLVMGWFLFQERFVTWRLIGVAAILLVIASFGAGASRWLPMQLALPPFLLGVVLTPCIWGALWLALAWHSSLQENLEVVFGRVRRLTLRRSVPTL